MTIQEMELLTEYLKGTFWTKEEGRVLELKIDKIQMTIDRFAKKTENNEQEILILNKRVKATENWIDKASPKLGLELEH